MKVGDCLCNRYKILGLAGEGRNFVFRGKDLKTGGLVAVKTPKNDDPADLQGLENEYRALSARRHPHLVQAKDWISPEEGGPALVLEWISGKTFDEWVKGAAPLDLAAVLYQAASVLIRIHADNCVVRDLKPTNILVCDAEPYPIAKLIDLGMAGESESEAGVGTAAYLAPEVLAGKPAAFASDIYSLGIIFFEAIHGELPFAGGAREKILDLMARSGLPQPPAEYADFRELLEGMMAFNPTDRITSLARFIEGIAGRFAGEPAPVDAKAIFDAWLSEWNAPKPDENGASERIFDSETDLLNELRRLPVTVQAETPARKIFAVTKGRKALAAMILQAEFERAGIVFAHGEWTVETDEYDLLVLPESELKNDDKNDLLLLCAVPGEPVAFSEMLEAYALFLREMEIDEQPTFPEDLTFSGLLEENSMIDILDPRDATAAITAAGAKEIESAHKAWLQAFPFAETDKDIKARLLWGAGIRSLESANALLEAAASLNAEPERALDRLRRAIRVVEEGALRGRESREIRYKAHKTSGVLLLRIKELEKAGEEFHAALKVARNLDPGRHAGGLNDLGIYYRRTGDFNQAATYFERAISIAEDIGDKERIAGCHNNIGGLFFSQGKYRSALESFNKAKPYLEKTGNRTALVRTLINIGAAHRLLAEIKEAEKAYSDCFKYIDAEKDIGPAATLEFNAAETAFILGEWNRAEERAKRALLYAERTDSREHRFNATDLLFRIALLRWDFANAIDRLKSLARQANETKAPHYILAHKLCLGEYRLMIGDRKGAGSILEGMKRTVKKTPDFADREPRYFLALARTLPPVEIGNPESTGSMANLLHQALGTSDREGDPWVLGRALRDFTRTMLKKSGERIADFNKVKKETAEPVGDKLLVAELTLDLAMEDLADADPERAGKAIELCAEIQPATENMPSIELRYHHATGLATNILGCRGDALDSLIRAAAILHEVAGEIPDKRDRTQFLCSEEHAKALQDLGRVSSLTTDLLSSDADSRRLQTLLDISRDLYTIPDLHELLHSVLDRAIRFSAAERGLMILFDIESDQSEDMKGKDLVIANRIPEGAYERGDLPISRSIVREVRSTGKPVVLADVMSEAEYRDRSSILELDLKSVMCAPLKILDRSTTVGEGEVIGFLYVDSRASNQNFDERDLQLFNILALQAATAIDNARLRERLSEENRQLRREIGERFSFGNLIGKSAAMNRVYDLIEKVGKTDANVLILGESGTGKELVAKTLHFNSPRRERLFVGVNCAALTESLLESELFGIEAGVATDVKRRIGLFEQADGGTLFLDEIGDMSLTTQARVLRVIQEKKLRRVGGNRDIDIDIRLICATNRDLKELIAEKKFREDLYYRLNVVAIVLPPLRERREDIPPLLDHFLQKHCKIQGKAIRGFSRRSRKLLLEYAWQGNVRELENQVERAVILADEGGIIQPQCLSQELYGGGEIPESDEESDVFPETYKLIQQLLSEKEAEILRSVLDKHNWNKTHSAKTLGVSRVGLNKIIARLGIVRN